MLTLCCLFFIAMTNIVFAVDRWQWIAANDSVDFFIDINTIKKTPDAEWLPLIPDTRNEIIFNGIQRYVTNHADSLQQHM